ncbi:hypothetical protein AMECASPLE_034273 [Ameca splendens]|uniref:ERAP1-like C-terminal domain-containing protein n=1 Tax=Ameca splendens TaxID=208324 RepID=A0ABV1A3G1_9TELE
MDDNTWLLGNINQTGYFRVNYDLQNWKLLIQQLHSNPQIISVGNRAGLIDDAFNLARRIPDSPRVKTNKKNNPTRPGGEAGTEFSTEFQEAPGDSSDCKTRDGGPGNVQEAGGELLPTRNQIRQWYVHKVELETEVEAARLRAPPE